jgi:hypothetical protein
MSQQVYTPGVGQLPFGNEMANPQSSNYQNDSASTVTETNLLRKEIEYTIFDSAPKRFDALKVFMNLKVEYKASDEFEFMESTFGRSALVAAANTVATAAVAGTTVSQAVTLDADSLKRIAPNYIIIYPTGETGVVVSIAGAVATVNSLTGAGLPAVTTGDKFSVMASIEADGDDKIRSSSRLDTITRYNYIQLFFRSHRWGRVELLKFKNAGTTDYLVKNKKEKIKQFRIDMFNAIFNGIRGEYAIADGMKAKAMGGLYPGMIAAGSPNPSVALSGLQAVFEATAFNTQFGDTGSTRYVFATDQMLYNLSKIYKDAKVRYTPDSKIADLNLDAIKLGGSTYPLVACELWREESCFPAEWANRIMVLDMENIHRCQLMGLESPAMNETDDRSQGSRETFKDYSIEGNLSIQHNNPLGSFIIDVTP